MKFIVVLTYFTDEAELRAKQYTTLINKCLLNKITYLSVYIAYHLHILLLFSSLLIHYTIHCLRLRRHKKSKKEPGPLRKTDINLKWGLPQISF